MLRRSDHRCSNAAAPKQHNTDEDKRRINEKRIPQAWSTKPAKLSQKDPEPRWTVKYSKAKPAEDGAPRMDLAVPGFASKNNIGIDRGHRLIRTQRVMDAAHRDRTQLPALVSEGDHRRGL